MEVEERKTYHLHFDSIMMREYQYIMIREWNWLGNDMSMKTELILDEMEYRST